MTDGKRSRCTFALAAHAGAVACAALTLPTEHFSPLWLFLFCLPGVAFLLLSASTIASHALSFAERLLLTVMMQVGLAFTIYQTPHAPIEQAALTYLLLSPLAYTSLRRRELDVLHSLFLSFCLLLIGSILRDQAPLPYVLGFAGCAAVVLHDESRRARSLARVADATSRLSLGRRAGNALVLAAACLFAFLGLFEVIGALPSPRRAAAPNASEAGERRVGLSTRFELNSGQGGPLNLIDDELVRVRVPRGDLAPDDLYLRCGQFDIAGVDRWKASDAARRERSHDLNRRPWSRPRVQGESTQRIGIERLEGLSGFVYLPPGTFELTAADPAPLRFLVNADADVVREAIPGGPIRYLADYQELGRYARAARPRRDTRRLTRLPASLGRRQDLAALAREWSGDARRAIDIAERLADGLGRRCRYALRDPQGSSSHALDNFLFGSREGFCMHFASAMAIMLRLQGVPCRIAVGLYGGQPGDDEGERMFGSRHAHAWVEIPFEELGWVVVDPTPASVLSSPNRRWPTPDEAVAAEAAEQPEPEDDANADEAGSWQLPVRAAWPWLALAALMGIMLLRPARPTRDPATTPPPLPDLRAARQMLDRVLQALRRAGHPRPASLSLERFAAALRRVEGLDTQRLEDGFHAYQDVRFGARPLDPARRAALASALDAARAAETKPAG